MPPVLMILIVIFNVSPPPGVFLATTSLEKIFKVFIKGPRVANDDALVFVLIGHIRSNQYFFTIKIHQVDRERLLVNPHHLEIQLAPINGRLYLSIKHITVISGMRK